MESTTEVQKIEHFHPLILRPPRSISNKLTIKAMASGRYFTRRDKNI